MFVLRYTSKYIHNILCTDIQTKTGHPDVLSCRRGITGGHRTLRLSSRVPLLAQTKQRVAKGRSFVAERRGPTWEIPQSSIVPRQHSHQITRATKHNDSPSRRPHKISIYPNRVTLALPCGDKTFGGLWIPQKHCDTTVNDTCYFFPHLNWSSSHNQANVFTPFATAQKSSTSRHGLNYGVLETNQTNTQKNEQSKSGLSNDRHPH